MICAGCDKAETFTLSEGTDSEKGKFVGTLPKGNSEVYYAVLNYNSSTVSFDGNNLVLGIAKNKSGWANNIPSSGIPAVAKIGNDGTVGLHHIFGLLKVTFSATEEFSLKKLALHDLAGNMLWGNCSVPVGADGELDCDHIAMTGGDNTITMTLNNPKKIGATPVSYYLPVPQGALDGGFSIVLYEADDTKSDGIGRAYTFMQKISGTKAMPRAGILAVNAPVTAKPESYDVKGRGYYKSLFVNAGMYLDKYFWADGDDGHSSNAIRAIGYLGLSEDYEFFVADGNNNESSQTKQTEVLVGNMDDVNGVLLYPDGAPRFRMVYVNGGSSSSHGPTLGDSGRDRFHTFFMNGGSYSGSCAGSFLSSTSVDGSNQYSANDKYTFGIFPGNLNHTHLPISISKYPKIYTDMIVVPGCAVTNYSGEFPLLANNRLEAVGHHGGSYLPENQSSVSGVEPLMQYAFTEAGSTDPQEDLNYYRTNNFGEGGNKNLRFWNVAETAKIWEVGNSNYISTWAYKNSAQSGRAVCTGSHPESTDRPCDIQYTGFMFRYAMDGNGTPIVKSPDLYVGSTRYMNDTPSSYASPATANAGIGDRQYHHFKFTVPSGGYDNIVLTLDSEYGSDSGYNLYLGLKKGGHAWLSDADYSLCNKGGKKELRIKHLSEGIWYVSVFCATEVTATPQTSRRPYYFNYTGNTDALNGVPYSIKIVANGFIDEYAPIAFVDDFTDSIND